MCKNEIQKMSQAALKKIQMMETAPLQYLVLSAFAGIYVAFGIALILLLGGPFARAGPPGTRLVRCPSFGIARPPVVFAGSVLLPGHSMFGAVVWLRGAVSWAHGGRVLL